MEQGIVAFLLTFVTLFTSELNAQFSQIRSEIPAALLDCYRYPELLQREHLLPMTTNVLIALIRKIERYQGTNLDARTTSLGLIHKFRIDGIERQPNVEHTEHIIPYATKRPEFFKQKLLLEKFLPSRYDVLLDSLSLVERCSLHWMMSNSVDPWERGDESFTCSRIQTGEYREGGRFKRSPKPIPGDPAVQQGWDPLASRDRDPLGSRDQQYSRDSSFSRDPLSRDQQYSRDSQYQRDYEGALNREPSWDAGFRQQQPQQQPQDPQVFQRDPSYTGSSFGSRVNQGNYEIPYNQAGLSTCPTENGVLFSKYGAYKAGMVIAGIAAGLQPQNVTLGNVLSSREPFGGRGTSSLYQQQRPGSVYRSQQQYGLSIDNRWAATVAGEVALMVLLKTPTGLPSMRVGLSGGWNDTCVPKWYFLREPYHETITDTQVRGSVDGIVLAYKMNDITRIDNTIKLSQILDMYYSEQGVFDSLINAGNRAQLFASLAPPSYVQDQSFNFALSLNPELPSSVSFADNNIISTATQTVASSFSGYLANLSPRSQQQGYRTGPQTESVVDLYLVLDFMWEFLEARRILTYLVDQFDISPQSSRFFLVNGRDGNIVINATYSCLDFHLNFTENAYRAQPTGYDQLRVLMELRQHFKWRMDVDRISNQGGGPPRVVLFMPHVTSVTYDKDRDDLWSITEDFRRNLPDVHFITTGAKDGSGLSLYDDYKDVFTLYLADLRGSVEPIVNRINQMPKRIINPLCGANWYAQSWSVPRNTYFNYIGTNSIQYFRLHPNYFFNSEVFRIKVQGFGYGMINVCHSRTNERPSANSTYLQDITCRQINTDSYIIEIGEPCVDFDYAIQCPPLFISVASGRPTIQQAFRCNEDNCRNPAQIKFSISSEGLTCHSGAASMKIHPHSVIFATLASLLVFFSKSKLV
ncbi:unnamed protein product [Bemisia tabaci]|uniref:Uncharacterized protein n=1 Tax=Bemisia tabaci TaxID=7038 RepID=A0A9P0AAM4_BEMTA|nr:unnamed protein product [Bemisia tabaci]